MSSGPLFGKMLLFALPLVASGVLQLLFSAADLVVVGRFSSDPFAQGSIGATASLNNLFINFAIGISIGANVVVARFYGAKNDKGVSKATHTAMLVGAMLGVIFGLAGVICARPILTLMDTPAENLEEAVLYITIIFIGMPVTLIYNFGSAVLRAMGDTARPLLFLTVAGVTNFFLNLFFVIVCHMSVEGVALATIISQCISAALVVICLMRSKGANKLTLRNLRIDKNCFASMLKIGFPAGLQSVIFAFSNVLIQSSINYFGSIAMNGNTIASSVEGFVYTAMNAIYQTNLSVSSQNYGAGKLDRMRKSLWYSLIIVSVIGLVLGISGTLLGNQILGIYAPGKPNDIKYGMLRLGIIMPSYFLCGVMEVLTGSMRAYNYGFLPMIVSLIGACGFRILWIYTIFEQYKTLEMLYVSYPISWLLTSLAHGVCLIIVTRKVRRLMSQPQ